MKKDLKFIETYFYNETKDLKISEIKFLETRASYFSVINCYKITTEQNINFYVFQGDTIPTNLYPIYPEETLHECYYKHIGFMAVYCSDLLNNNFILNFIGKFSLFPIIDRRLDEIMKEIKLGKNSNQLSAVANQIRDCYLYLTDHLINNNISQSTDFKQNNFTDNISEFLSLIIPGKESEIRRNTINGIAKKGWQFNSNLIHKDSITLFDVLISFNILQLLVSTISNLMVGNDMPFNKIKCPNCNSEKHTMCKTQKNKSYSYKCKDCGEIFEVNLQELVKKLD